MIVGRLIPAGTGLAFHDARKRKAAGLLAGNSNAAEAEVNEAKAAAEAMFTDVEPVAETSNVEASAE